MELLLPAEGSGVPDPGSGRAMAGLQEECNLSGYEDRTEVDGGLTSLQETDVSLFRGMAYIGWDCLRRNERPPAASISRLPG